MFRSPKAYYALLSITLVLILTGCELRRDGDSGADAQSVGDLSPTLAPLGADSSELTDVAPPTVIVVDPTATVSTLEAGAAESLDEPAVPTSQPAVDLSSEAVNDSQVEQASVEPENFILPEEEVTVEEVPAEELTAEAPKVEEAALEQPVIANAVSDELPSGGPIATNPPASATTGDYAITPGNGAHIVQPGDTLFSLSQRYGTTVEAIMLANGLTSEMIYEGQTLNITGYDSGYNAAPPAYAPVAPGNEGVHIVASGETLFSIAVRYGTSVEALAGVNGIPYPYTIYPGQTLTVSTYPDNPYYAPNPNGNAYPPNAYTAPGNPYAVPSGLATHVVAPGETLFSIAQRYGLTAESIATANGLVNPNQIVIGQVLYLP